MKHGAVSHSSRSSRNAAGRPLWRACISMAGCRYAESSDFEREGTISSRLIALAIGAVVAGAVAFAAVLALLGQGSGSGTAEVRETLCEIELGPARCPGLPKFGPALNARVFFDNHENAGRNRERCLRRAQEFLSACKAGQPVTARFFTGRQVVESRIAR